jgi:hypothetical protein
VHGTVGAPSATAEFHLIINGFEADAGGAASLPCNNSGRFSSVEVERKEIMKANNETATLRASENTARRCSLREVSPRWIINLLSLRYGSVHSWFYHGGPRLALASSRTGRVLLHALCVLRRPSHSSWHWRGILREFSAVRRFRAAAPALRAGCLGTRRFQDKGFGAQCPS